MSVDTINLVTSFDPNLSVTDADECLVARGFDDFRCSSTPDDETPTDCPAVEFIAETTGIHYLLVSGGSCESGDAQYEIGVNADEPELTLIAAGIDEIEMNSVTHSVTGTATVVIDSEDAPTTESGFAD